MAKIRLPVSIKQWSKDPLYPVRILLGFRIKAEPSANTDKMSVGNYPSDAENVTSEKIRYLSSNTRKGQKCVHIGRKIPGIRIDQHP